MGQQVRFIVDGRVLSVEREIIEISVYIRNLLRNLMDNDDEMSSDSEVESGSEGEMIADPNMNIDRASKLEGGKGNNKKKEKGSIEIPIDSITYETMELVIHWCKHYHQTHIYEARKNSSTNTNTNMTATEAATASTTLNVDNWPDNVIENYQTNMNDSVVDMWERNFLDVDSETLKSIILASNFLDIKPLLETSCKVIAEIFRGKSPKEIINAFNAARSVH